MFEGDEEMSEKETKHYGSALAFCTLTSACVVLECCGPEGAGQLWVLVGIWAILGSFR